jgi:anti-anti-sigma factor
MLEITETLKKREAILKISGMMVDADAMKLNDRVKNLVVQGTKNIILDLSDVKLMNSCFGLGILTACWACVNRSGGRLTIANPSPKVSQLLRMTKLDQILKIADSAEGE